MEIIEQGKSWLEEGEGPDAVLEEATAQLKSADKKGKAAWLLVTAEAYLAKAKPDDALDAASEATALFKELGLKAPEAAGACAIASAHLAKQSWDDAIAATTRALDLCTDAGDLKGEAVMYVKLARAYLQQMMDPYVGARSALMAVQIFSELGDKQGEAAALQTCAEAYLLYDPEEALKVSKEAIAACELAGDFKGKAAVQQTVQAARSQLATMQNADQAGAFAARGDGHVNYKWPRYAQQRGYASPDPFAVEEYVAPTNKNEKHGAKAKTPNFMRRAFKWTAGHHQTDGAWYRQEFHFHPPRVAQ